MNVILTEVLLILVLLIANGVFAMSELAVMSARKARLQEKADQGDSSAQAALDLANAPERFLSTVQIGITLIGILAGAFGGATIAEKIGDILKGVPGLAPYAEGIGLGVVVLVITFLSLVIGELVPKQIALSHPESIAKAVARPMRLLSRLASPAVHLLSGATRAVMKLLGIKPSTEPSVTENEVRVLIEQGTEAGTFEEAEREMLHNVLRLGDRRVGALMTPRPDVVWLDVMDSPAELRQTIVDSKHSRFPVASGSLDSLLGVVQAKDLLVQSLDANTVDLKAAIAQPLFIPENTSALRALELFREHRTTLALVLDEYGGFEGLVTVNDIVACIVGDVSLAHVDPTPGVTQREDGSWLVDGMMNIEDVKELLEVTELSGEDSGNFRTLAGFILHCLEQIPKPGAHFERDAHRFEVLDMDGNRIDKVLISAISSTQNPSTPIASTQFPSSDS